MKKILPFIVLLFFAGCAKNNNLASESQCAAKENDFTGEGLAGKWEFTEYYYSIGGPLIYEPASPQTILQLNTDSTVCGDYLKNVVKYTTREEKSGNYTERIITFIKADASTISRRYYINGNQLNFGPYPAICIEGCGEKLLRVK